MIVRGVYECQLDEVIGRDFKELIWEELKHTLLIEHYLSSYKYREVGHLMIEWIEISSYSGYLIGWEDYLSLKDRSFGETLDEQILEKQWLIWVVYDQRLVRQSNHESLKSKELF